MHLYELTGAKQFRDLRPEEALARLKREFDLGKTKLKPLGKGQSAVALTDGEKVYKFWYKDSAYESFVNVALAHQDNPYFPKFFSKIKTIPKFLKLGTIQRDVRYVKIELLKPYTLLQSFTIWDDQAIVSKLPDVFANRLEFELLFELAQTGLSADKMLERVLKDHIRANRVLIAPEILLEKANPEIIKMLKALELIDKGLGSSDSYFDYQRSNMALRGSQPVILDPVCNDQDLNISGSILKLDRIQLKV